MSIENEVLIVDANILDDPDFDPSGSDLVVAENPENHELEEGVESQPTEQKVGKTAISRSILVDKPVRNQSPNNLPSIEAIRTWRKHAKIPKKDMEGASEEAQLRRIADHKLLSASEEVGLAKRIETGDYSAKQELMNCNLRLVIKAAKKYSKALGGKISLTEFDLIDEGTIGLVRAAEKFDYRRGYRFTTYATAWIKQAMERGITNTSPTIKIPVNIDQETRKIDKTILEFMKKHGREPSFDEIIVSSTSKKPITIKEEEYKRVQRLRTVTSTNVPVGEDGSTEFGDLLQSDQLSPPEEVMENETKDMVNGLLARLPAEERAALRDYFGIEGQDEEFIPSQKWAFKNPGQQKLINAGLKSLHNILINTYGEDSEEKLMSLLAA